MKQHAHQVQTLELGTVWLEFGRGRMPFPSLKKLTVLSFRTIMSLHEFMELLRGAPLLVENKTRGVSDISDVVGGVPPTVTHQCL